MWWQSHPQRELSYLSPCWQTDALLAVVVFPVIICIIIYNKLHVKGTMADWCMPLIFCMRGGRNKRLLLLLEIHWQFILPVNWEVLCIKTFMRQNRKETDSDRLKRWKEKKREVGDWGLEKKQIWVWVEMVSLVTAYLLRQTFLVFLEKTKHY